MRDFYVDNSVEHIGDGDTCLRDKETHRICAWYVGTEPKVWQSMLAKGDVYASQAHWDNEKGMIL